MIASAMPGTNGALPASLSGKAEVKQGISTLEEAKTQLIAEAKVSSSYIRELRFRSIKGIHSAFLYHDLLLLTEADMIMN